MRLIPFHSNSLLDGHDFLEPFDNLFSLFSSNSGAMCTDIVEDSDNIKLIMDLPGIPKDNVQVKLEEGNLVIIASNNTSTKESLDGGNYIRKERQCGKYSRSFYVGKDITQEDIKAKFNNGTLTLTFPKKDKKAQSSCRFIDIE